MKTKNINLSLVLMAFGLTITNTGCNGLAHVSVPGDVKDGLGDKITVIKSSSTTTVNKNPIQSIKISGQGNHLQHVCIKDAKTKLKVRIKAGLNNQPLMPFSLTPVDWFSLPWRFYKTTPATYSNLQASLELASTNDHADLFSQINPSTLVVSASNQADFSRSLADYNSVRAAVDPALMVADAPLTMPEYSDYVYGSSNTDQLCTFWEEARGLCKKVSNILEQSLYQACKPDEVKVYIHTIIADSPCNADEANWCQGQPMALIPDYQPWSLTVEAVTDQSVEFFE